MYVVFKHEMSITTSNASFRPQVQ